MTHPDEFTLNEYADDQLSRAARADVESHLQVCGACRSWVDEIRSLGDAARALPSAVPPRRDLWNAIESQIVDSEASKTDGRIPSARGEEAAARGLEGRPRSRFQLRHLSAAAVVALLIGAGAWLSLTGDSESTQPSLATGEPEAAAAAATAHFAALDELDREYGEAAADLRAVLEAGEGRLAPETMAVVEENLRIIEDAIRESREVLERDPAAPAVLSSLRGMYEMRLDVLRRAVRISEVRG